MTALKVRNMALCGAFAAFLTICAWISVPMGAISFTMQTFAALLALGLLGGKWGGISILVYLLIGAMGVPVFSGFQGGAAALLGATGGYLLGFLAAGLLYWLITHFRSQGLFPLLAMALGMVLCYAIGSVWFAFVYLPGTGLEAVLLGCVAPYVLPDTVKLLLAWFFTRRLRRFV